MKSSKQSRQTIKAKRLAKKLAALERDIANRAAEQAKLDVAAGGEVVNTTALAPDGSYDVPDFVRRGYYVNRPFVCKDCGKAEVWTASQQKWWYEVAKGGVWTTASRCRPCRRKERERRDEARRVHLEGLARKQGNSQTEDNTGK